MSSKKALSKLSFKDYHLKSGIAIWIHGLMTRKESLKLPHGEPLQYVISFKVCSRCGGSGVIKKEEAPEEDREKE